LTVEVVVVDPWDREHVEHLRIHKATFTVALKPGTIREGEYKVLVGRKSGLDRIPIPVAVRRKRKP